MAEEKEENKKKRKGFFKEFKEFVTRGNVLDLAVGIIVGGAFTAIVTALCDHILKPIINFVLALIIGSDSLDGVYTYLKKVEVADEAGKMIPDLEKSIYIDWGSLINAIINFLLIALVLFLIIKLINHLREMSKNARENMEEATKKYRQRNAAKSEDETPVKEQAKPEATQENVAAEAPQETAEAEEPKEEQPQQAEEPEESGGGQPQQAEAPQEGNSEQPQQAEAEEPQQEKAPEENATEAADTEKE